MNIFQFKTSKQIFDKAIYIECIKNILLVHKPNQVLIVSVLGLVEAKINFNTSKYIAEIELYYIKETKYIRLYKKNDQLYRSEDDYEAKFTDLDANSFMHDINSTLEDILLSIGPSFYVLMDNEGNTLLIYLTTKLFVLYKVNAKGFLVSKYISNNQKILFKESSSF